ncbi:N-acetylmuramoyl-L-alanine amidase family protein [Thermoactinomyces mirandus]|uniref:N-acetylmuramoyl-L-alanine amidase n=1 Tax=Thermoactinomyces mirandus TaxID=2756294 RepID=A0A7W2AR09_9BACL|nr:N-acetylmuramoyl-L-alanine amidase [Thermoactinomyces mirandus]MBA4602494.1 N-acetylmuramoyl-L-alanine amidase [Thermoactinomyces mirandus]
MGAYVVIDPGHGGKDQGASGFGLAEKNVVLSISQRINHFFGQYEGVSVSLTRWDDRFLELSERADFANARKCDLFLSIHNNAASESASGFETFIHPNAASRTAQYQNILHSAVMNYLKQYNIKDRGKKRANFAVLRETTMPAVLIENLFITNQKENQLLRDPKFLDGLAEAVVEGVAKIFGLKKKQPKPMYRITVDGKTVYDTAYESKITDAILEAVRKGAREISLKKIK